MTKENLSWLQGPQTHTHIRYVGEPNDLSDENRQFDYQSALGYLTMLTGRNDVRITDTNHALLSFDDLDNTKRPENILSKLWQEEIVRKASAYTLERVGIIRSANPNIIVGVEADIVGSGGELSLNEECLSQIDYTVASFHSFIWKIFTDKRRMSPDELIDMYLGVLDNKNVKVLGHPARQSSKLTAPLKYQDYIPVVQKMKRTGVAYEVSMLSDLTHKEEELNLEVLRLCSIEGVNIVFGLDFHSLQETSVLKGVDFAEDALGENPEKSFLQNRNIHFRIFRRLIKNVNVLKNLGIEKQMVVNRSNEAFDTWLKSK